MVNEFGLQRKQEENKMLFDYLKVFITGGIICALVQLLMEKTKMMPGRVMVTLVVRGAILGAIGPSELFAKWAGAGSPVPLLGI